MAFASEPGTRTTGSLLSEAKVTRSGALSLGVLANAHAGSAHAERLSAGAGSSRSWEGGGAAWRKREKLAHAPEFDGF